MTFADNHDVTRLASILTNKRHIPLAYGLLFGMPGIPCIYYGSEWGEEGTKSPDNDYALRPCFDAPQAKRSHRSDPPPDRSSQRKRCAVQRFLSKYRYYKSSAYFRAQNRKRAIPCCRQRIRLQNSQPDTMS